MLPPQRPRLRPLDIRTVEHLGQLYLQLSDPQQLTDQALMVPQPLGLALAFFTGEYTVPEICDVFLLQFGVRPPDWMVADLVQALDQALMLENERSVAARWQAIQRYRQAAYRRSVQAGKAYPAEPSKLWGLLQNYLEASNVQPATIDWRRPVGLLSPHIDYPRGGAVYAQIWKRAVQAAREAELVILLGTDHHGHDPLTLTMQHYATPYGILPTARPIVEQLAALVGEEAVFAGELRHVSEHSLDLVAVWLHHLRGGEPVEMLPILCGSLHPFHIDPASSLYAPAQHPTLNAVLATLQQVMYGRKTLIIASGDLAHVGPAFGGPPVDDMGCWQIQASDEALIDAMQQGDAEGFYQTLLESKNSNNVCGVVPIYLAMNLLRAASNAPLYGEQFGYAICPADAAGTSVVTICGMMFS